MSVRIVPYNGNRWQVDLRVRLADGSKHREKTVISSRSKTAAKRWADNRERHLLQHGPAEKAKEVPTLTEFQSRFLDGYPQTSAPHSPAR